MSRWNSLKDSAPASTQRVLLFTPTSVTNLRFRVVDGSDVRILTDATHWQSLSPPVDDQD
jgi:hypothetical protein